MLKLTLLPLALLALTHSVIAQQLPNAGTQLQQIPPAPTPLKSTPTVDIEPSRAAPRLSADNTKMIVNRLAVSGAQLYSEAALVAVTEFKSGSEMTLMELRAMAQKIADYYRRNGYFAAQAYLPAQDIQDGVVTIAVVEGRYGKITVQNQSALSDDVAHGLLDGLEAGDVVASAPLESRLLLLSDIAGVKVRSTLAPGAVAGTSDLLVDVSPGPRVSGSIDADNAGNRYTGEYRVGATVNLNNPAGHGDVASLRVLTAGSGLNYARASYQMQFGKATGGVAYSYLEYKLGREFDSLGAHGTAQIASIYGSYPLIRSRNTNLYARLAFDNATFRDKIDSTLSATDRRSQGLTASLVGDHLDGFGGGGASSYSLALKTGNIDIQTPAVRSFDALTAQTQGHFDKLVFSAMRLQKVTDTISFYGAVSGQRASKNLDESEKMGLGGMYGVRAYPEGEAYGDQGYLITLEARMMLPKFSEQMAGTLQLVAFADSGTVTTNRNPWTAGSNTRTLSGAGVGLNWTDPGNFAARAFYARKLGNEVATSAPDKSGRFWLQVVKYF